MLLTIPRIERQEVGRALAEVVDLTVHAPPVLAIAAVPGTVLGRIGSPSTTSPAAWAGAALRKLHDAPVPPWPGRGGQDLAELAAELDRECQRLVADGVLPVDLVTRNRRVADAALRPWTPRFTHGLTEENVDT